MQFPLEQCSSQKDRDIHIPRALSESHAVRLSVAMGQRLPKGTRKGKAGRGLLWVLAIAGEASRIKSRD